MLEVSPAELEESFEIKQEIASLLYLTQKKNCEIIDFSSYHKPQQSGLPEGV